MAFPENETEAASPRLPRFVRFRDLAAAGIVDNWQQLHRLIDDYGFPPGVQLSPNIVPRKGSVSRLANSASAR